MSRRPTSCPSRIPSVVLSPIVFSAAKRGPALSCGDAPQQRPMLSVVSPLIAPSAVPGVGEPKYTPLPRPKGLTVGTLAPGEAPAGITPLVNYETRTLPSIPAWYTDRKPTSADCEYVCKQERDCMAQHFDAARSSCALYGRPTNSTKPSRASSSAPSPTQQPSAARSGALPPPSSAAALRREPAHGKYTNPIVCSNSPDPGAIVRGPDAETVVVVATGGNRKGGAFPLWHSADGGRTFELRRYALPEAPKWWDEEALLSVERMQDLLVTGPGFNRSAEGGHARAATVPGGSGARRRGERLSKELLRKEWARVKLWAPEVHFLNNHYVLYYTATDQVHISPISRLYLPKPKPKPKPSPKPSPKPKPNHRPEQRALRRRGHLRPRGRALRGRDGQAAAALPWRGAAGDHRPDHVRARGHAAPPLEGRRQPF